MQLVDYTRLLTSLAQKNLELVFQMGKDQYKGFTAKVGIAYKDYIVKMLERCAFTKTLLYGDEAVFLYDFYIETKFKRRYSGEQPQLVTIDNILKLGQNITFYGSGGIGKTTLLKHLFIETVHKTDYIPIFVELRNYEKGVKLEDYIYNSLASLGFSLEKKFFLETLKRGKHVVYLDGFDEVSLEFRADLINSINTLSDGFSDNYYIMSSRPLDTSHFGPRSFVNLELERFDKDSALEFIRNVKNYRKPSVQEKFLIELDSNLYDRYTSFCSNPLLLTIMLMTFHEFAEIPENVHIFYQRAFSTLYSQHDATKDEFVRRKRTGEDGLSSEEFIKLFAATSASSYYDGKVVFSEYELYEFIHQAMSLQDIKVQPENFKADLLESVCILLKEGWEYSYQHRSFQEYFTALYIKDLEADEQFVMLKELLERNPNLIKTDMVYDFLLEMVGIRFEKNFIIPYIQEIKELVEESSSKEERYFIYLQECNVKKVTFFPDLLRDFGNKADGPEIVEFIKYKDSAIMNFIDYVYKKYKSLFAHIQPVSELLDRPKGFGVFRELGYEERFLDDETSLSIDWEEDLLNDSDDFRSILPFAKDYLEKLEFAFLLSKELQKKHKEGPVSKMKRMKKERLLERNGENLELFSSIFS